MMDAGNINGPNSSLLLQREIFGVSNSQTFIIHEVFKTTN